MIILWDKVLVEFFDRICLKTPRGGPFFGESSYLSFAVARSKIENLKSVVIVKNC